MVPSVECELEEMEPNIVKKEIDYHREEPDAREEPEIVLKPILKRPLSPCEPADLSKRPEAVTCVPEINHLCPDDVLIKEEPNDANSDTDTDPDR